ncbi:hypothetical protein [Geoalkalibacter halelectricus]|uniref:Uncharacterized protein n=1 Tax=Geoalkalibacter halelectricus TaxID=2847045 RepID=A0ABY5ZNB8_9BACT|nr:hypothetical protein [Geoalkalibacter halelectricus]MDO3377317.1 hypothetical protein [Geoalkalibacter halelectricus]UWZ79189.1 hypothetical protein L9S41_16110 [Geoalkalibacter halelectricus]
MQLIIGIVAGGLISWIISHQYYKKSSIKVPPWAEEIIGRLPEVPPTKQKLLELFQDALTDGEVQIHPVLGIVACPDCKSPISEFREKAFGDDRVTIASITCPHCGWHQSVEV